MEETKLPPPSTLPTFTTTRTISESNSDPVLRDTLSGDPPTLNDSIINNSSPSVCNRQQFNYVHIIVSGYYFKTLQETLERFPNTLLGSAKKRERFWCNERQALVFHRCRQSFESILYFYQSGGSLIQPINVEQNVFLDEAKFFKLPLLNYFLVENQNEEDLLSKKQEVKSRGDLLDRAHTIVQDSTTLGWKALAMFDVGMTFAFVALQCLRTERSFIDNTHELQIVASESMCIVWFLGIFLLRLIIAPEKKRFLFQFMSVVDVAVILSFLIDFFIYLKLTDEDEVIGLTPIVRLTGFLRLFNIARYSELLFCLGVALKRSLADLAQVMVLIFLVTFIFATLAYYMEEDSSNTDPENFTTFASVFDAIYWGTITIATVGYGDIYPKSAGGKSVGAALALLGLPLIAIPMPLIMSKFDGYYQDIKRKKENEEVRDKILEEMRHPNNSEDEDEPPPPPPSPPPSSQPAYPTWDGANGSSHPLTHTRTSTPNSCSSSSQNSLLKPAERANMTWDEVVREGYGWGMKKKNSSPSSRICLSFSDLSRIFPSVDTVNNHGSQFDQDSSSSLPSLTDGFLSPMVCYQKLNKKDHEEEGKKKKSSANSIHSAGSSC